MESIINNPKSFTFMVKKGRKQINGTLSDFVDFVFENKKIYSSLPLSGISTTIPKYRPSTNIIVKINFHNLFTQSITINKKYKITQIIQTYPTVQSMQSVQSGGQGYTYSVSQPPIAGRIIVDSYLDCCPPYYPSSISNSQSGGTNNNNGVGTYLAINEPKIGRLPQYRAYNSYNAPI